MMRIFLKHNVLVLISLVLLAASCRQEEASAVPTPIPTAVNTAVPAATATATAPPATAAPQPSPTPVRPAIVVENQALAEDGALTIASVAVPEAAWLVIHAQHNGQVGEVLGFTAVAPNNADDLTVTIDPLQATPRLVAILHQDGGETGQFEFPGPDDPWLEDGEAVSAGFGVDIQVALPAITIADQEVLDDGLVLVKSVYTPNPGWLLIHADDDGAAGELLGHVFLRAGTSENIVVSIPWRQATPTLHAILLEDDGRSTRLDYPDGDLPIIVNGQPVMVSFTVALPPDVHVLDQPAVDGKIEIERVVSDGPGWLVAYFDEGGLPARIIGSAHLEDGLNEHIVMEVVERAVTDQVHILIHNDDEPIGQFTFPGSDEPRLYHGRLPFPFTFQTSLGNYLVAQDQSLTDSSVVIPYVVADIPTWLIIRSGAAPDEGGILGATWLPAGINRDVVVEIEADSVGETLYAVLHIDLDEPEQFDFPGDDTPLEHNGRVIQSPFTVSLP
ncbi:MAG: hypothetical protein GY803_26085 [Chloroflexi bacterium]|nr:hypothetical protein [Chloroflexota bacterium]